MAFIQAPTNRNENPANTGRVERAFDAWDSKGRRIGARANLLEADRTIFTTSVWVPDGQEAPPPKPAAHVYGFWPCATRDGEWFGASHPCSWFDTTAERDAAIAKYFAGAEKRAMKANTKPAQA